MSAIHRVDFGLPALLEFRGPDAVRFLNGQVTQDVRRVVGGKISLPACVTDAKGKLQFRVTLMATDDGALWVEAAAGLEDDLANRLTKYLIADDVEFTDLTGSRRLIHFTGPVPEPASGAGILARESNRYGVAGTDWWISAAVGDPEVAFETTGDAGALESLRIRNGIPAWGKELVAGMLPPEARLDETDISYQKGCYIGQEVISRIKSAGKVNRRLTRFSFAPGEPVEPGPLVDEAGNPSGELTSVDSSVIDGGCAGLGFIKRGAEGPCYRTTGGTLVSVRLG